MMNEVNWKDVFFITQILLMLGAFCGQIPFCAGVLMFELAILWFVILPIFILVCINVIFGGGGYALLLPFLPLLLLFTI